MIKYRLYVNVSVWAALGVSLVYALAVWSGFYGFGNDYYAAYSKENLAWGGWTDRLGWVLSTMTVGRVHIGVFIVSFLTSLATAFLIRESLSRGRNKFFSLFFILLLVAIHTWPVIMSTSNAMRQGLAMSFIFLSLVFFARDRFFWMMFFLFLSAFSHKSGLMFLGLALAAHLCKKLIRRSFGLHFLIGLAAFSVAFFILPFYAVLEEESRVISGDFRVPFLIISLSYIALSTYKKTFLRSGYHLVVYYFSFVFPVFFFRGLNWEFERLGMIMLFPYIFSFGDFLNKRSSVVYLPGTFLALLMLTISTGMYSSLKS